MTYKECKKISIGSSDFASLVVVGCDGESRADAKMLRFGRDGSYSAYLCDANTEIGEHYALEMMVDYWLKIYDDSDLVVNLHSPNDKVMRYKIYRAGETGCIIQVIPRQANKRI